MMAKRIHYSYDLSKNKKYSERVLVTLPDGSVKTIRTLRLGKLRLQAYGLIANSLPFPQASITVCDAGSRSVSDTISGTATSPAYMTRTC